MAPSDSLAQELRATLRLAGPVVAAQLAFISMSFVDTVMVGRLGPEALAGVALGHTLFFFFAIVGMGTVQAVGPMVSQAVGAETPEVAARSARQGLWLALGLGVPTVLVLSSLGPALRWAGQSPVAVEGAMAYLRAVRWGVFPFLGFAALRSFVEGLSRPLFSMSARRFAIFVLSLGLLAAGTGPLPARAQQVLVDDPTSVRSGAAQLEAWHSPEESWIAPAVRVRPRLELAAGAAFLGTGVEDRRTVEYSVESKVLVRPGTTHRFGAAVVGGAGIREFGVSRGRPATVYGYGILSQDLLPGLTAYQNVGWGHKEHGPHQLTWGARLDWSPVDRFTIIGEASGQGRRDPSFQAALRTVLLTDRIEMDVSVTRSGPFDARSTWATVGLTFMSAPLY